MPTGVSMTARASWSDHAPGPAVAWTSDSNSRRSGSCWSAVTGHQVDQAAGIHGGDVAVVEHRAEVEHHHAVGDLHHGVDVMRDHDDRGALVCEGASKGEHVGRLPYAEGCRRFVQDDD